MTLSAPAHLPTSAVAAGWTARLLFALYGAVTVAATAYFTFAAPVEEGGVSSGADWLVAAWNMAMGIGLLFVATRIGADRRPVLALAAVLLLSHVVFGLVKRYAYGEDETWVFFLVDLALLGLVGVLVALGSRHPTA